MGHILLTGGTGHLGRELVPRLLEADHSVRVMSRRAAEPGEAKEVEWAQVDLISGQGLAEAVSSADIILHAASNAVKRQVDVDGRIGPIWAVINPDKLGSVPPLSPLATRG